MSSSQRDDPWVKRGRILKWEVMKAELKRRKAILYRLEIANIRADIQQREMQEIEEIDKRAATQKKHVRFASEVEFASYQEMPQGIRDDYEFEDVEEYAPRETEKEEQTRLRKEFEAVDKTRLIVVGDDDDDVKGFSYSDYRRPLIDEKHAFSYSSYRRPRIDENLRSANRWSKARKESKKRLKDAERKESRERLKAIQEESMYSVGNRTFIGSDDEE